MESPLTLEHGASIDCFIHDTSLAFWAYMSLDWEQRIGAEAVSRDLVPELFCLYRIATADSVGEEQKASRSCSHLLLFTIQAAYTQFKISKRQ